MICSSDFCHWGNSFEYTNLFKNSKLPIYKQIELLDNNALVSIEKGNLGEFEDYL